MALKEFSDILKPELDDREYLHLTLPNSLQVLLISDPSTDKSSAAMDVNVGHLSDPDEFPGIAHFCEHLLFMGTKKYPKENEYSQYLSEHGGHSNAFTSTENTNYYFDINSEFLEGALDRFAQFFIHPLFDDSCTDREMNAVDSEHKKNIQSDNWRFYQLEKDLSNPSHPYRKFGTGNLQTLKQIPESKGLDIRKALLEFHSNYYSANTMRLVILGKEPLKILEQWAIEKFSQVINQNISPPSFDGHPLTENELMKTTFIKPVKDMKTLEITFPFPDSSSKYLSQPSRYLSHLVGHESEGSILSLLKSRGLALGLHAGASRGGKNFEFFRISVDLTDEGVEDYEKVVLTVFQYLKMLQQTPIQKWIYDECSKSAEISFRFKEKTSPSTFASRVSGQMHLYDKKHVLSGPYLMTDYDPETISQLIQLLNVRNCKIIVVSPDFSTEKFSKAKFYGTEYTILEFSPEFVKSIETSVLDPFLYLPKPNQFMPDDLRVSKQVEKQEFPKILLSNNQIRLWHKRDDTFLVPKAYIWLNLINTEVYRSPLACVLSKLLVELLKDSMIEYSYYAEVAGLGYNLESNTEGLLLSIEGFNDKLDKLLVTILEKIVKFKALPERFKLIKEQTMRSYKNWFMESPHQHAMYYVTFITQENLWTTSEKIEALEQITDHVMVERFAANLLSHLNIEGLVHGNISKENATSLGELALSILSFKPLPFSLRFPSMRTQLLPIDHLIVRKNVYNQENLNSAIEYYLQVGDYENHQLRAQLALFSQIVNEPCFDQLRTKEQLGYMVFSGTRKQTGVLGFRIIIQSEQHPMYLEWRIEEFIQKIKNLLIEMDDAEFKKHANALSNRLLEKDKNLHQESKKLWAHVNSKYYDFSQNRRDADIVLSLSKSDIQAFYRDFISVACPNRRKLSTHFISSKAIYPLSEEVIARLDTLNVKNSIVEDEDDLRILKFGMELSKAAKPHCSIKEFLY